MRKKRRFFLLFIKILFATITAPHYHYTTTTLSPHYNNTITTLPLPLHCHYHCTTTTPSLHYHNTITTLPRHYHYTTTTTTTTITTITLLPLHYHYTTTKLPLHCHYTTTRTTPPLRYYCITTTISQYYHNTITTLPLPLHYHDDTTTQHHSNHHRRGSVSLLIAARNSKGEQTALTWRYESLSAFTSNYYAEHQIFIIFTINSEIALLKNCKQLVIAIYYIWTILNCDASSAHSKTSGSHAWAVLDKSMSKNCMCVCI